MPLNSYVRENGETIVTSGERLTIENALEFSRIISEALNASQHVAIEFEPSVEMDITAIQILCAACKSAAGRSKIFSYQGRRPQAMAEIINRCGAERHSACRQNDNSTCIWFGGGN
jgi:anti-anti-sigma regulatory factor